MRWEGLKLNRVLFADPRRTSTNGLSPGSGLAGSAGQWDSGEPRGNLGVSTAAIRENSTTVESKVLKGFKIPLTALHRPDKVLLCECGTYTCLYTRTRVRALFSPRSRRKWGSVGCRLASLFRCAVLFSFTAARTAARICSINEGWQTVTVAGYEILETDVVVLYNSITSFAARPLSRPASTSVRADLRGPRKNLYFGYFSRNKPESAIHTAGISATSYTWPES